MKRFSLLISFLFCIFYVDGNLSAQNRSLDSLKLLLKNPTNDTNEIIILNSISKELTNTGDYERARNYAEQAKILSDRLKYAPGQGDYFSALGVIYYYQGNYSEALSSHFESLKIREKLHDRKGIASSYNNIAIIYTYQKNHKEALHYLLPALSIKQELGDKKGLISTYNNIGLAYQGLKDYAQAIKYLRLALSISIEMKSSKGIGNAYSNLGGVFIDQGNFDSSYVYFKKAYAVREKVNYKQGMMTALVQLGNSCVGLKKYSEAKQSFDEAFRIATEMHEKEGIKNSYFGFSQLYAAQGNYQLAYKNFELFTEMRDSIFNEEGADNAVRTEMNYTFAKKQAEQKADQDKKDEAFKAEAKRKQLVIYFVSGSLILMLIFAVFMVRSIINKRKANRELDLRNKKIEQAYHIIETKNEEITASINYAQRIQRAILPEMEEIKKALPDSFVLYLPKDIVGGDFYYFNKRGEDIFLAAADSTGHGVPGAFMSLIGSKELSLANMNSDSPGKILQHLNVGLKNTLKQNNLDATKDGMDIAFVKLSGNRLTFSGANRPLWIIRNHSNDTEEIKPVKTAIAGFTPDEQEFAEHEFSMSKGDVFYIFTDGYTDQFGNVKNNEQKKLTTKKFRELLLSIHNDEMDAQKEHLRAFIEKWRGESEQLDDILVIGVRV